MAMATAAELDQPARQRRGQAYVALAAVAWSTAGVLQRQLSLDVATQVAGRALFAAIALALFVAVAERGRVALAWRSIGIAGVGLALCLAVASGSFIAALNHTTVARVLFIQAISPVLAALLARVLLGEPVGRRTALAMAIALGGVTLMLGAPGGGDLAGDGLALLMALAFALALVITRHRRDVSMAPATCLSQLFLLAAFAAVRDARRDRRRRRRGARAARRRADRARARAADDRRAPDPRRPGRPDHAARGRPRAALGVAGAERAAGRRHARGRRGRDRRDRDPGVRNAGERARRDAPPP